MQGLCVVKITFILISKSSDRVKKVKLTPKRLDEQKIKYCFSGWILFYMLAKSNSNLKVKQ